MKSLSPSEITEIFNQSVKTVIDESCAPVIQQLSHAVAQLKAGGIDVGLSLTGWVGPDSFKNDIASQSATGGGILRVGANEHVLTLITMESGAPCMKIYVSYYNRTLGGIDTRTSVFDVMNDDNALIEFQLHVIMLAARNEMIAQNDVCGAFESTRAIALLSKPSSLTFDNGMTAKAAQQKASGGPKS